MDKNKPAPAEQAQGQAAEQGDGDSRSRFIANPDEFQTKILHAMYRAAQRGESVERMHFDVCEIIAQRAGSAKPSEQAEAPHKPAVTVDTPEFRDLCLSCSSALLLSDMSGFEAIAKLIAHIDAHTARAVAEALEGQLTEMGPGGALYLPQAWPDAWHALRDDVLSGVDGLDNDQINIVLGILDNYEPVAAIQPSQPAGAKPSADQAKSIISGVREFYFGMLSSYLRNDSGNVIDHARSAETVELVYRSIADRFTAPPAAVQSDTELPPLPACDLISYEPHGTPDCYSANKVCAYGQVCHAMGRGAAVREYVANGTFKQSDSERDAARYQWLRDQSGAECVVESFWSDCRRIVDLDDKSIDAAMASAALQKKEG